MEFLQFLAEKHAKKNLILKRLDAAKRNLPWIFQDRFLLFYERCMMLNWLLNNS